MQKQNPTQRSAPSPAQPHPQKAPPPDPNCDILEVPDDPTNPALYPARAKRDIPHNLSPEIKLQIVEYVCECIGQGDFLSDLCGLENMPCPNTFRSWLRDSVEFNVLYEGAKEDREEHYAMVSRRQAAEPVPTYKDSAGNTRVDPAALADKRLRIQTTQRILNMLTVKARHKDFDAAAAIAENNKQALTYRRDPLAEKGRSQQEAINGYRQYHLDKFGEFLTDEQGLEAIKEICPFYYERDLRIYCHDRPKPQDPAPRDPSAPRPPTLWDLANSIYGKPRPDA